MKNKNIFIEKVLKSRKAFIEIIVLVITLSFLINIFATTFYESKILSSTQLLWLSLILIIITLLYVMVRIIGRREREKKYIGFFVFDKDKNSLIKVPRYRFSEKAVQYLNALFSENIAFKNSWDNEPLEKIYEFKDGKHTHNKNLFSIKLLHELGDYIFLTELSLHLSDYFNKSHFKSEQLKIFDRKEIPEILLSNKFLEMFSKPMEERPSFSQHSTDKQHSGKVVMAFGKDGAIFDHFELILPKNSKISRGKSGQLILDTDRFVLEYFVDFDGYSTVLPTFYKEYVLGVDDFKKYIDYKFDILIKVKFKFLALIYPSGWEYYRWLDSFMNRMKKTYSKNYHFRKISWKSIQTFIESKKSYIS